MADRVTIQMALKADLVRSDLTAGLVWFVNYAALDPTSVKVSDLDLHGAGMLPVDVEKFAHRWLAFSRSVDIEHDGIGRPVHVIESFFNAPDIAAPAWPINAHAVRLDVSQSQEALVGLQTGALNSVSLDAYTFNKVVRLPAAQAKSMLTGTEFGGTVIPVSIKDWVADLAKMGYPGVISVDQVGADLFVAQRSCGMSIAIAIADGGIEVSSGSVPWNRIAATLYESGSLVSTKKFIGPELGSKPGSAAGQPIDYAPWDADKVLAMLEEYGLSSNKYSNAFAELSADTKKGYLPHHVVHGDSMSVSKPGVIEALSRLSDVPETLRHSAKMHLLGHLDKIIASEASGVA